MQRVSKPNALFLVKAFNPGGALATTFWIDQFVRMPNRSRSWDQVHNSIQNYLHELGERTGVRYELYAWGEREEVIEKYQDFLMGCEDLLIS